MDALSHLRSWLFPQYCKLCSQSLRRWAQLCQHCCATFSTFTEPDLLVRADIQRLFPLRYVDHLVALQWYRPPVSIWLKQYKYAHQLHYQVAGHSFYSSIYIPLAVLRIGNGPIVSCLSLWLILGLFGAASINVCCFGSRRCHKVYLQPMLFARPLSTKQQAKLGARSRRKNLANAFTVKRHVQGMHVAIVDDVMTTGATADSAARKLKEAGAKECISLGCVPNRKVKEPAKAGSLGYSPRA